MQNYVKKTKYFINKKNVLIIVKKKSIAKRHFWKKKKIIKKLYKTNIKKSWKKIIKKPKDRPTIKGWSYTKSRAELTNQDFVETKKLRKKCIKVWRKVKRKWEWRVFNQKKVTRLKVRRAIHNWVRFNRYWKMFAWKKKKRKKKKKLSWNFAFIFKQLVPKQIHKYYWWILYKSNKKQKIKKYNTFNQNKLSLKARNFFKNKLYFKKFIIKYYNFRRHYQIKNLYKNALKRNNKILRLFFILERQLKTISVRMHFFFSLGKALIWIKHGLIYVNNNRVKLPQHLVHLNDLVQLTTSKRWWYAKIPGRKFKKKMARQLLKKYRTYNALEVSYLSFSAIVFFMPYKIENLKFYVTHKKKRWLKTKVFSFLINCFK